MKPFKHIFLAFIACVSMVSCKKHSEVSYQGEDRIHFGPEMARYYTAGALYTDTLKRFTFAYLSQDVLVDTVYFDVYTMGMPYATDRRFSIQQVQVPGANNAVPGQHYLAFSSEEYQKITVVPASQVHLRLPIVLFRHASLSTQEFTLEFRLMENEHFLLGPSNLTWRRLVFSDQLIRPALWSGFNETQYLGTYSQEKHRFMISVTGQPWDQDFLAKIIPDTELLHYWLSRVKSALASYNQSGQGPKLDENNQPILFP